MRKVTTINLNNNAYQIEEDGFDALRIYLDNAARALADNPDREEILSDLEQAIADKCRLILGPHKTVVSCAEIEGILAEMGPVAGSMDDVASEAAGASEQTGATGNSASGASGSSSYRSRRLYRLDEGRKWAGICQGLAAYADIDVSFVRLAVILLTVFTGFFPGLFIYIVMSFVVPAASTPEELAAAHGQPFRAQEVVDRVKKKYGDFRADRQAKRRERYRMRHSGWWSPQQAMQPPPGYTAQVTGSVLLPLLTVLSAAWFAAMAIAAYVAWNSWRFTDLEIWTYGPWHGYPDFPRWVALVAIIAIYALLAIPIGAGRRAARYYANGGQAHGWTDAWSGMLWIAVVALILLGAWYLMPELQDLLRYQLHGSQVIRL